MKRKILIVDDDAFFVSRLQSILSDEFDIDVALSFEEAKDKFRPDYYDAVMIDVRLREVEGDVSGFLLLKEFKKYDPTLPIIMMSKYEDILKSVKSVELGADLFINKNAFSLEEYKDVLRDIFDRRHKEIEDLRMISLEGIESSFNIYKRLAEVELMYIREAIWRCKGKKMEIVRVLGYTNRFTLRRRVLRIFKKFPEFKNKYRDVWELFCKG